MRYIHLPIPIWLNGKWVPCRMWKERPLVVTWPRQFDPTALTPPEYAVGDDIRIKAGRVTFSGMIHSIQIDVSRIRSDRNREEQISKVYHKTNLVYHVEVFGAVWKIYPENILGRTIKHSHRSAPVELLDALRSLSLGD